MLSDFAVANYPTFPCVAGILTPLAKDIATVTALGQDSDVNVLQHLFQAHLIGER